jgi:hypothetical protein
MKPPAKCRHQLYLAIGRDWFKAFIDQVGRNLAGGTRTLGRADPHEGRGGEKP